MENNKEENISRREFFKKSAQKLLPILGVVALGGSNILSSCMKVEDEVSGTPDVGGGGSNTGCSGGNCTGTCYAWCKTACVDTCGNNCTALCRSGCGGNCTGSCSSGCSTTCLTTCKGHIK